MTMNRLLAPGAVLGALLLLPSLTDAQSARANDSAPAVRRTGGWTADRRELAVGEVLTVLLDERTLASGRKEQSGREDQTRDLDLGINPPSVGASAMGPIDGSVRTSKRAASTQRGDMRRDLAFATTMSVRIIARNADGSYQVKGSRVLDVEKNRQEISLAGVVRAQDVTPRNEVDGARIADAQIVVKGKGMGKTRGGLVGRVIGAVWP